MPAPAAAACALPFAADDARPLVLVSYSTSFQDQVATLQRVADAVADLPARVLITLGHAPHAAVLPHASLVATHAGHGTGMAALR